MYKVKNQYARGTETFRESFKQLTDAKKYVEEKISADAAMNIKVIYKIYDAVDELIEEFDSTKYKPSSSSQTSNEGLQGGGAGKAASFRPSPLATAPRPPGMPQNWHNEDEEKKNK